jgi:hypothetical protein
VNYRSMIAALAAGVMLAGCSQSVNPSEASNADSFNVPLRSEASHARAAGANGVIYVGNSLPAENPTVAIYNTPRNNQIASISDGANDPELSVSPKGDLYAASAIHFQINVYGSNHKLLRTLTREVDGPRQVAFDSNGNVYVRELKKIVIFPNGRQDKLRSIREQALGMTIDSQNNLYLSNANGDEIDVFKPGSKTPSRVITDSVNGPGSLAIDSNGNLYVSMASSSQCGSVVVYSVTTKKVEYTISQGVCYPELLTVGGDGNLYILNAKIGQDGGVSIYPLGQNVLLRTVTDDINEPWGMTLDANYNLYVVSHTGVTVYASGQTGVLRTLSGKANEPLSVAYGR